MTKLVVYKNVKSTQQNHRFEDMEGFWFAIGLCFVSYFPPSLVERLHHGNVTRHITAT